jgi:uncharacterized membrane protein YedE/YeeE
VALVVGSRSGLARARRRANGGVLASGLVAIVGGALLLTTVVSVRQSALFLVGAGAGVALYHASFGFTSAWRDVITRRRGAGLRAQMLRLAITTTLFVPMIAHGSIFGHAVRGSVAPAGVPVLAGAFLFGIGMQLGGGCASGTLFTVGGGSVRMVITLAAFIAGSVLGVRFAGVWDQAPAFRPMSLVGDVGPVPALVFSLAAYLAIAGLSWATEKAEVPAAAANPQQARALVKGPWPLLAGAVALAGVNISTLVLAGRPWGVTSAFALWGSKALMVAGVDVVSWPYWQTAGRAADLQASVLRDVTSVMDVGIMLGAATAAALAGRFAPVWRVPFRSLLAAIIGGLMLGYGARIAFGCNIGAYFSGVSSTSLHGWVWLIAAFSGNVLGTKLRPVFGLSA